MLDLFAGSHHILYARARVGDCGQLRVVGVVAACSVAPAQAIDGPRPRHHQQPGGHGAARVVVAGGGAPRLREDLLGDVFGVFRTPHDPQGQGIDGRGVAIVDVGQRCLIARRHPLERRPRSAALIAASSPRRPAAALWNSGPDTIASLSDLRQRPGAGRAGLGAVTRIDVIITYNAVMAATTNPFVYGEIVTSEAFANRVGERDRLRRDLAAGQKVFLISPRRYGKSSLVRDVLRSLAREGVLTVEVTVAASSSYVGFLESYARALVAADTPVSRLRRWTSDLLAQRAARGALRRQDQRRQRLQPGLPGRAHRPRHGAPRRRGVRAAGPHRRGSQAADGHHARRVPGGGVVRRGQRRACAARRRAGPARRSATCSPARSRR